MKDALGLVHVYTGNGKGKTTAALGLAFRAAGHGFKVAIFQFLKGAGYSGEIEAVRKFDNIHLRQLGQDCPWAEEMKDGNVMCGSCRYCFTIHADDEKRCRDGFKLARDAMSSGKYDLVILDEMNVAMDKGLVPVKDVLSALKEKSPKTEVVLTGRRAPQAIIDAADLVTEMREIKHPMHKNLLGRVGIDY